MKVYDKQGSLLQTSASSIDAHANDVDAHVNGATAGQLLVATAATVAAWQNTGVVLDTPTIQGTVNAGTGLTMPAFTLAGTVTLGGQTFDAGSGHLTIATTGAGEGIDITSTQDGATGVAIDLRTISASPAAWDVLASIAAYGKDSIGTEEPYAGIEFVIEDPTNPESGAINFYLASGGDYDFRMTLYSYSYLTLRYSADDASAPGFVSEKYRANPTDDDNAIWIAGYALNDADDPILFGTITLNCGDVSEDSEDGQWEFRLINDGSSNLAMKIWDDGTVWADRGFNADDAFWVANTQVVGPRGASIFDAAGGAVIDIQARNSLNALLARCRAHGLISV